MESNKGRHLVEGAHALLQSNLAEGAGNGGVVLAVHCQPRPDSLQREQQHAGAAACSCPATLTQIASETVLRSGSDR